jgi:lipopolysaccharide/colanic/teichoic acid biosynthesis glycosyltransferase
MKNIRTLNISETGPKTTFFWIMKRLFDIFFSMALLPILLLFIIIVYFLNYYWNPGTIFYVQDRMGKDCKLFKIIKFRTMIDVQVITRDFNDPLEHERITHLGYFLRVARIDELPQIINVLKGDMSLIGPRPDYYEHALIYIMKIAGYKSRHVIRPGITGLSQTHLGYAEGSKAARKKVFVDQLYIKNAGFLLDSKILIKTILVILRVKGQ